MAESKPVASRKLRRRLFRALELVDHLAFGHLDFTKNYGKAEFLGNKLYLDSAKPDFPGKRMVARKAALG